MPAETKWMHKSQRIGGAASPALISGAGVSGWTLDGNPSHGATPPTTMAAPDNTTQGGLKQTDAASGYTKYLHHALFDLGCVDGQMAMYDRLLHVSGFSGTSTSEQFCDPGHGYVAVTRTNDPDGGSGQGNGIFVEINTQIGTSVITLTVNYKNQDDTAKAATVTLGGTGRREQARWIEVPLVAGDTGVRSVKSVQLSATTGTAGDFGIVIAYRYITMALGAAHAEAWCGPIHGFIKIPVDACIMFAFWPSTTAATTLVPAFEVHLTFVDKPD